MKLTDLSKVQELQDELIDAIRVQVEAGKLPDAPVPCYAKLPGGVRVELMPVRKEVVETVARCRRQILVAKLQELGVEVE